MPVYKDEKTGKYYFSCYYVDWTGEKKKKMQRGFSLQREAKEAERKFLEHYIASSDITFATLYDKYMEDFKARFKPTTYHTKETVLKKHILPYFNNLPLTDISPSTIRQWQNKLLTSDYSGEYIRYLNTQLSAIFNYAIKYHGIKQNPVKIAGVIGKKEKKLEFWTLDEFNQAMKFVKSPYDVPLMLLFYTGLRCGELLALTIADYNSTAHTISVNKTYAKIKGTEYIQPPKTPKSNRVITVPIEVCRLLDEYIKKLYEPSSTTRIFENITKHGIGYNLNSIQKKAGLHHIRIHDLRHSHASLLIHLNVNILAISERLGHEDITTTLNVYSHLYQEQKDELTTKLNNLF